MSFFRSVSVYVHLMSENRVTSKNSYPGTGRFAFPHVLIKNYFSKYRTEFRVYICKTRSLKHYYYYSCSRTQAVGPLCTPLEPSRLKLDHCPSRAPVFHLAGRWYSSEAPDVVSLGASVFSQPRLGSHKLRAWACPRRTCQPVPLQALCPPCHFK